MISQHFVEFIGGVAALIFGIHAIATRRVAFTDENDEPNSWVYGWRAVAVGCAALVASLVFFASSVGMINWSSLSS